MKNSKKTDKIKSVIKIFIDIVLFMLLSYFVKKKLDSFSTLIGNGLFSMLLYVLVLVIAVVLAPVSAIPLVLIVSNLWGWFSAAMLSIIGWVIGATMAFTIARKYGVSLVKKLVPIKKIASIENRIPKKNIFWSIVFLRIVVPVDILSYALGLFSQISTKRYVLATIIGVLPFAFIFAYLGTMPFYYQIIALLIGILIFLPGLLVAIRYDKAKNVRKELGGQYGACDRTRYMKAFNSFRRRSPVCFALLATFGFSVFRFPFSVFKRVKRMLMRRKILLVIPMLIALLIVFCIIPLFFKSDKETYQFVSTWGSKGSTPVQFSGPIGIAIDKAGFIYVSDAENNRIQKFTSEGIFVAQWGSEGSSPGQLSRPMHIAFSPDGKLYVAEYLNDRIQIFDTEGNSLGVIGTTGEEPGQFDAPAGVDVDMEGNIYVADFYNHRVQKISPSGKFLAFIGGPGRVGNGKLHYPTDITRSLDGSIYVADAYNFRVQQFSSSGKFLKKWGGPLGLGIPGKWKGWFKVATGTAADSEGNIYVADFDNHRVQKFSPKGDYITAFGEAGSEEGQFDRPTDIAVDSNGRVYVVDFGNNRIQVFQQE